MNGTRARRWLLSLPLVLWAAGPANAQSVHQQCPGPEVVNPVYEQCTAGSCEMVMACDPLADSCDFDHNAVCVHITGGDGYVTMGDGERLYMFGFGWVDRDADPDTVVANNTLHAEASAPTLGNGTVYGEPYRLYAGDELYLSLTNVGMVMRPDLSDEHTVHWHGFPDASAVFDGVPDNSIFIGMGATLTYYYNIQKEGTYMYHCHVEATEHMQMGMLGNLYVRSAQDRLAAGTPLAGGFVHQAGYKYAYSDGDGSTRYDVEYPIQLTAFDPDFHHASESTQPLPFAAMRDRYFLMNGRGYPDTVDPGFIYTDYDGDGNPDVDHTGQLFSSQKLTSLIQANPGQRILLRISNLEVSGTTTLRSLGIPMRVVGKDARLLRAVSEDGSSYENLYYTTNSVELGGGESIDAILDTTGVAPGTYYLYTANLHHLANDAENFGGAMTHIVVSAGAVE